MTFKRAEPNHDLRTLAASYCTWVLDKPRRILTGHYVPVDVELAKAISATYESLEVDNSADPDVARCYGALLDELIDQWNWLIDAGYVLTPWEDEGQPYANSFEMAADLRDNNRLYFFTGGEPHPFLNIETITGYTGNEMLRAVHDCFGHGAEGFGFGPRGEENAWIHHSMMFSPDAQRALSTETRGQNSWVNFGPHSHLPADERPYADQKVDLLPLHLTNWKGALGAALAGNTERLVA